METTRFEQTAPNGVKCYSTKPFKELGEHETTVWKFLVWSWKFTIRETIKGLRK